MSVSTGAMVAPACRAWGCSFCGPFKARRYARAIDNAGYTYFLTFTRAPADYRQGVARLRHRLAQEGPIEWAWTKEHGRKTGMRHIHACTRADWIDYRRMKHHARRAGFGKVSWGLRGGAEHAGSYAAKAARYGSKSTVSNYAAWLDWTDGRPWRWSRGYTGGVPVRDWIARNAPARDPGPWRIVKVDPARPRGYRTLEYVEQRWTHPLRPDAAERLLAMHVGAREHRPSDAALEWAAWLSRECEPA